MLYTMEPLQTISGTCMVWLSSLLLSTTNCTVLMEKFHIRNTRRITGRVMLVRPALWKSECACACTKYPDCQTFTYNKLSEMCQVYAGTSPGVGRAEDFVNIYLKTGSKSTVSKRNFTKGRLLVSWGRALKQISLDAHSVESYHPYFRLHIQDLAFAEKQQLLIASHGKRLDSCFLDTENCKLLKSTVISYIAVDDDSALLFLTIRKSGIKKMSLNGRWYQDFSIKGVDNVRVAPYPKEKVLFVVERGINKYSYTGDFITAIISEEALDIALDPVTTSLFYIDQVPRELGIRRKLLQTRKMYGEIHIPLKKKTESLLYHRKLLFTSEYDRIYYIDFTGGTLATKVIHTGLGGNGRKRLGRTSFLTYCYIP